MASERDIVLKAWDQNWRSDVAIIKDVATKGKFISLCIEYLARRRGVPIAESRRYFEVQVDIYVSRLLRDKLVCKAEDVLRNVERDVKCVYYQFAFDTEDEGVKEAIFGHLTKANPLKFDEEKAEFEFFWRVLEDVDKCDKLKRDVIDEIRISNLESLFKEDEFYRKQLLARVFYERPQNLEILERLDKICAWRHIVKNGLNDDIIRWLEIFRNVKNKTFIEDVNHPKILEKYASWEIQTEMFDFAMTSIDNPSEVLRNCFASHGYFFADEKDDVLKVVRRLATTECLCTESVALKCLPTAKYFVELEILPPLLDSFIEPDSIKQLVKEFPDKIPLIDLIMALKSTNFDTPERFLELSKAASTYLEKTVGQNFYNENPIVQVTEFLLSGGSLESLLNTNEFTTVKDIPYIQSLLSRKNDAELNCSTTVEELFKRYREIDLNEVDKEAGGKPISFSNVHLSQKYSQKFKLNFLFYLKQERSSYAVYNLLIEQLIGYSQISKVQLFNAAEVAAELALGNFENRNLASHCIAFIEMLGFDTRNLRSYFKLLTLASKDNPELIKDDCRLFKLVGPSERALDIKSDKLFPLRDYDAIWNISKSYGVEPFFHLRELAKSDEWWKVLVLCQYFQISLNQLKSIMPDFACRATGENLLRALSSESSVDRQKRRMSFSKPNPKKKSRHPRRQTFSQTASREMVTSSTNSSTDTNSLFKQSSQLKFFKYTRNLDIFAIILLSSTSVPDEKITSFQQFVEILQDSNLYSTSINLLKNSIQFELPILSILSAVMNDEHLEWCWGVWLAISIGVFEELIKNATNFQNFAVSLIEQSVKTGFIATLHKSFLVFYEDNQFSLFTKFLQQTSNHEFTEESVNQIQMFLLAVSNNEIVFPFFDPTFEKDDILMLSIRLLVIHLKNSFHSVYHQQLFLEVVCKSGISDISPSIDFCLLRKLFEIILFTDVEINLDSFISNSGEENKILKEYEEICNKLQSQKFFDKSIELAKFLNLPTDNIIYEKWIYMYETNETDFDFDTCEVETIKCSLQPEILINFYLHIASKIPQPCEKKYLIHKRALDVIKKHHLFPNESFNRDRIEYEMILCYLRSDQTIKELKIYYSEYFEQILLQERCVLYKSFHELKELAGIDELSISEREKLTKTEKAKLENLLKKLIDEGDIVEALRLQAMFDYRPIDLHFLVFCMALAEGLTSIYNLSNNERTLLSDVVKSAISKFNRRTLNAAKSASSSSSPSKTNDSSDGNSTCEFEEIPSREKQDVLEALQGLASRLNHGVNLGKRIVMSYRAAMYLDKDYLDVLKTKDPLVLINYAINEDCIQKLLVASDIFSSNHMSQSEIADFLAYEIVTAIVRPRFYIFTAGQSNALTPQNRNNLWGYDLENDFHYFLELCPNTTLLGNTLLDYCDTLKIYRKYQDDGDYEVELEENPQIANVFDNLREIIRKYGLPNEKPATTQVLSHKKQNTINIELLIKAHDCFVHECSMEGISNVLTRTKNLNSILGTAKSWNLIVRLLTGIGRYREMYYCFDILIKNHQFESLLGKFETTKINGLRHAIITYINEKCPENQEFLKLTAHHFLMYKELAEMLEKEADVTINEVLSNTIPNVTPPRRNSDDKKSAILRLKCNQEVSRNLQKVLSDYSQATENYLLDNKLRLAQKSASNAELVAMQIDLVNKAALTANQSCVCVLNVASEDVFKELVNNELRVPQSLILQRAFPYEINWMEAILNQYIILGREQYLTEYCERMDLTDDVIENIVRSFQMLPLIMPHMVKNMSKLIEVIQSVVVKYRLSSLLGFKRIVTSVINDQGVYYLKDTSYGKSDTFPCDV